MRILLTLALAVPPLLSAGTTIPAHYKAWQWQRVIEPASDQPANEQCIVLDADLYRAAAPGLRDVRLLQDGRELAYALQESYDDRALHAGLAGQPDRSIYSTVLQIPLQTTAPGVGGNLEQGVGMLAQHVPAERIELIPEVGGSATPAMVSLHLLATPTGRNGLVHSRSPSLEGEVIDEQLDANHPVTLTAIGANLQTSAQVSVTVRADGARFTQVRLQMHQRSLCYQPLSSAPLLLLYGNTDARPPRYEYAAHFQPTAAPPLAHLGNMQPNPIYQAKAAAGFTLTRPQRLSLAACIALAGFLLTAVPLLRSR